VILGTGDGFLGGQLEILISKEDATRDIGRFVSKGCVRDEKEQEKPGLWQVGICEARNCSYPDLKNEDGKEVGSLESVAEWKF
jgi:hypothetical protein